MSVYLTLAEAKSFLTEIYENAYYSTLTSSIEDAELQGDIDEVEAEVDAGIKRAYDKTITGAQSLLMIKGIIKRMLLLKAHMRMDYANVPIAVQDGSISASVLVGQIASGKKLLPDEVQAPKANNFEGVYGTETNQNKPVFQRSSMRYF